MTSLMKPISDLLKVLLSALRVNVRPKNVGQIGRHVEPSDFYAIGEELDGARVVSCNLESEVIGGRRLSNVVTGLVRNDGAFITHVRPLL